MDLRTVARRLKLSADDVKALKLGWASSQRRMPKDGIPFLSAGFVAGACREIGLSEEAAEMAATACSRIAGNDAVEAFFWYCHKSLYGDRQHWHDDDRSWPSLSKALGDDARMFNLLVLLSGVPRMREWNQAHSVPSEVVRETLSDIVGGLEWRRHRDSGRGLGLRIHDVAWFANFVRGDLYRLGRLQFQFGSFYCRVRVFRHSSGAVLALCDEGVHFDQSNLRVSHHHRNDSGVWATELTIEDEHITGHPVLPAGQVLARKVSLPTAEWRQVLAHDDPALNIHMPGGRPLAHDECGESFRRAIEFFPRHFPERPFVGFCCESWLLDGQLEDLLPPTSNMVRFQRDVYLVPAVMDNHELLRTVFHGPLEDLANAPRETSLQRAIVERLERGEKLIPRAGGCFLLPEDLNWGAEVYRRQELDGFLG